MDIPKFTREELEDAVIGGIEDYLGEDYISSPRLTLNTSLGELISNDSEYGFALRSIEKKLGLNGVVLDALYADNTFNEIFGERNNITLKRFIDLYQNSLEELPSMYKTLGLTGIDWSY